MDWFRMYHEFASDPKVQSMPEAMQRRLVMLLCLRCSNALVTLQDDEIAFALRINEADLAETKALFIRKKFINEDWEVLQWDKRQFVSDSSAPRVAKHRAAKKEAAESAKSKDVTTCNVTVTPQNRTDTEQIHNRTESTNTPIPPEGAKPERKRNAICLKTFIDECKLKGEMPIPDDALAIRYASEVGIPSDFLWLQWREFLDRYKLPDAKRYKDWRIVFYKSVKGNWFKLWYIDANGDYLLTTQGMQAKKQHGDKAA